MLTVLSQRAMKYGLKSCSGFSQRLFEKKVEYFAFGANMDEERLKTKGIFPAKSRTTKLEGFSVNIDVPCEYINKGFASVKKEDGASIYGVTHLISQYEMLMIDILEWVPFQFHKRITGAVVDVDSGESMEAHFYVAAHPKEGLKTSVGYRDMLVSAAEKYGFPIDYLNYLRNLPVSEHFEHDPGFRLSNPGKRRLLEKELAHVYEIHDKWRSKLCNLIP